jgi:undecaprenyl-diphosphatase
LAEKIPKSGRGFEAGEPDQEDGTSTKRNVIGRKEVTDWQAVFLGFIQGMTEFLPISSSGHLRLAESVFEEMPEENVLFEVFLHAVTLLVILLVLRKDVLRIFKDRKLLKLILISSFMTILVVKLGNLEKIFKTAHLRFVLVTEILTGLFLLLSDGLNRKKQVFQCSKTWGALFIGLAQGLAVIPGLSRSGLTIGAAFLLGWECREAFTYSFLISIPALLGAMFLQLGDLAKNATSLPSRVFVLGALPTFFFGSLTLIFLRSYVPKGLGLFGFYCLLLGLGGFCALSLGYMPGLS